MDKYRKEQPFPLDRENIIPFSLEKRRSELNELVQNYPIYIPVEKLSKFLGMKDHWTRHAYPGFGYRRRIPGAPPARHFQRTYR